MAQTILIVDDDELIRRSLGFHLEKAGYRVLAAASAETALDMARMQLPDLVLLDINLPGMDGLQALRLFRQELPVPVIFVTARRRELDEILGLELGATDYVTKPFDKDVLLARVRAALRQVEEAQPRQQTPSAPLVAGDLTIIPDAHQVLVGQRPVELTPREFQLLQALAREAGRVVPADQLLERVWGAEFAGQPQVVYVHIRWLREKLEEEPDRPRRILTVRGVGYKLMPQEV